MESAIRKRQSVKTDTSQHKKKDQPTICNSFLSSFSEEEKDKIRLRYQKSSKKQKKKKKRNPRAKQSVSMYNSAKCSLSLRGSVNWFLVFFSRLLACACVMEPRNDLLHSTRSSFFSEALVHFSRFVCSVLRHLI